MKSEILQNKKKPAFIVWIYGRLRATHLTVLQNSVESNALHATAKYVSFNIHCVITTGTEHGTLPLLWSALWQFLVVAQQLK